MPKRRSRKEDGVAEEEEEEQGGGEEVEAGEPEEGSSDKANAMVNEPQDEDDDKDDGHRRRRRRVSNDDDEEEYEQPPEVGDEQEEDDVEGMEGVLDEEEDVDLVDEEEAEQGEEDAAEEEKFQRKSINKPGKLAEAGIIKEIHLENFMCHKKLVVKLGRNANAITGDNGSGKSAILAAIQICLGANARRTHRARNLKDLVRRDGGISNAKIQVTLLNGGDDAYKPEIYGDAITVERCISLNNGYNGYKLLDHKKHEQSRKKSDVDDMLDYLNIQVENPVSILDQEESKKFLTGKAEDKYKFFMKATDLERCDQTYARTIEKLQELDDAHKIAAEALGPRQTDVQNKKKKWDAHKALDKLELKLRETKSKQVWASYMEEESKYNDSVQRLEDCRTKVQRKEKELEEFEAELNDPTNNQEGMQARIQGLIAESTEQVTLKRQLEDDFRRAMAPFKQGETQLNQFKRELQTAKKEVGAAQKRLKEYRDQMMAHEGSAESDRARMTQQLQQLEEERERCKEKADELKQATSESLRAFEELEPEVKEAKARAHNLLRSLDNAKRTLRGLQDAGDELAMFGPKVKPLYERVEKAKRERKFMGPVIGPIGMYVKVLPGKEEYAGLAEHALGSGMLDRFIVTCHEDRAVLQRLRSGLDCVRECGIFVQKQLPRYRVPEPAVPGTETIASVLTSSEDLVFNCLVDNAQIDRRALTASKESSEELLLVTQQDGSFRMRDSNIKKVFFLPRGDSWEISGGGNGIFHISNERPQLRATIGIDKSQAIANAERDVQQVSLEMKEATTAEAKLEQEHSNRTKAWNRAKRTMQTNDERFHQLAAKIDSLNADLQASVSVTFDPSDYEDEVAQAEGKVQQIKDTESRLREELANREPEIQEIKGRLNEVTARISKVKADIETVQAEQTKLLETQTQTQSQIEKKRAKLDKFRENVRAIEIEVKNSKATVTDTLKAARLTHYYFQVFKTKQEEANTGTDVNDSEEPSEEQLQDIEPCKVNRTASYYAERLKAGQIALEKERKNRKISTESPDEAYEIFVKAQQDYSKAAAECHALEEKLAQLTKDIRKREKKKLDFRAYLTRQSKEKFEEFLNLNGYSGDLTFDHGDDSKSRTLTLEVEKKGSGNDAGKTGKKTDVKGLSGGERSFTTMCLLLALGEKLETPFRIFDEFDVFLDAQARKLVMQTMIHMAKKLENRQFIFITPQDLSSLNQDEKFKIFKLNPPARHSDGFSQQTLNFPTQGSNN